MNLDDLNGLPAAEAENELLKCCGSHRWARAMVARRPFASVERLQQAAEEEWWKLGRADWVEAFSHHPRIGDRVGTGGWESQEQSGVRGAPEARLRELEQLNREYEQKFGYVFLIFATGKGADEMLGALRVRLLNREDTELQNAAAEQAKITRLRLAKLTGADPSLRSG